MTFDIKSFNGQVVWIVGASSGIGAALATQLNLEGARIAVSARREDVLRKVASTIGAEWTLPLDVSEVSTIRNATDQLIENAGRIDRVIFMSASYGPMTLSGIDLQQVRAIVETNLLGAYNLLEVVYPQLIRQKGGQISLCGSISGYTGLPQSQPYASTKAALINLTESLRAEAEGTGVDIKLISPGFVRTPLTDKNKFEMPFIVESEVAAERISRGLKKAGFEVVFPRRFAFLIKFLSRLPYWLQFHLMQAGLKKL